MLPRRYVCVSVLLHAVHVFVCLCLCLSLSLSHTQVRETHKTKRKHTNTHKLHNIISTRTHKPNQKQFLNNNNNNITHHITSHHTHTHKETFRSASPFMKLSTFDPRPIYTTFADDCNVNSLTHTDFEANLLHFLKSVKISEYYLVTCRAIHSQVFRKDSIGVSCSVLESYLR